MKKMVYIAGPMSGIKNFNREKFLEAEDELKCLGYFTVNPHSIDDCSGVSFKLQNYLSGESLGRFWTEKFMNINTEILKNCDMICLLQGFEFSRGSVHEVGIAYRLGLSPLEISNGKVSSVSFGSVFKKISKACHDCN